MFFMLKNSYLINVLLNNFYFFERYCYTILNISWKTHSKIWKVHMKDQNCGRLKVEEIFLRLKWKVGFFLFIDRQNDE